ncbi:MAG TPA: hypothetical protein VMU51_34250 [Mycobacteriales bacterium]|nr:hypothetical protein [Mycobacteriales bacterium]
MFVTSRDAIAAALSDVDGVTGHRTRPTTLIPGNAWPRLASIDHGPGGAFSATWHVVVVMHGDEAVAAEQLDALLPALVEALGPVLYVDQAAPVQLDTEVGKVLAVQLTGRSE